MPWNAAVRTAYEALLDGPMGDALGSFTGPGFAIPGRPLLLEKLESIESGSSGPVPSEDDHLTTAQAFDLWITRAAYAFWMERIQVWPWRLRDKAVAHLRPLLAFDWQGLVLRPGSQWMMHGVFDVDPAQRCTEAIFASLVLSLTGQPLVDEQDVVERLIGAMRANDWRHVTGLWENYEGRPQRGSWGTPTFDLADVRELNAGECHINSNYLVLLLRAFNIPAHIGKAWPHWLAVDFEKLHTDGHCFVRFPTIGRSLSHGDDVQNRLLVNIPAYLAMRTDNFMGAHLLGPGDGLAHYDASRATDYDDFTNWCLWIGSDPGDPPFDVPGLFASGQLRGKLENIHVDQGYADRPGAPDPVPPLFDAEYIDTLMAWVEAKLAKT
jgi:hypothetical protein